MPARFINREVTDLVADLNLIGESCFTIDVMNYAMECLVDQKWDYDNDKDHSDNLDNFLEWAFNSEYISFYRDSEIELEHYNGGDIMILLQECSEFFQEFDTHLTVGNEKKLINEFAYAYAFRIKRDEIETLFNLVWEEYEEDDESDDDTVVIY